MVRRFILCLLIVFSLPVLAENSSFDLSLSKQTVWQREQLMVTLTVITDDQFARLDSETFKQNGLTIIPRALQSEEQGKELKLTLSWQVFPFISGDHTLKLPRIRYRPNSGKPYALDIPAQTIHVKPLPVYVPPTMPVGQIKLLSHWQNSWLISPKKLYQWQFEVQSAEVAPQTLPAISRFLVNSPKIQLFPAKKALKNVKNRGGVFNNQHYSVPFKALGAATLALPVISVQYFDPQQGKLQKTILKTPFVLVAEPWWLYLLAFVLLGLFFYKILPLIYQYFARRKAIHAALQSLKMATHYDETHAALKQFSKAKGWAENSPLESMVEKIPSSEFKRLIEQLQSNQYSTRKEDDIKRVSLALHASLKTYKK